MRASLAVHSRESSGRSPRRRCRHSRISSRTARLAHAHRDAGRFCRGKSDTPSAPPRRVGICPRVPARSTRLPGRGLHCSRDSGSKQTTSSEWGSLVTGLSPLLETNLRAEPSEKLYATDASPDGAGGCAASITQEDWLAQYDSAEKKGEHVRLDWKGEEPPSNMHDGRAAAAITSKLSWTTMVFLPSLQGQEHQPPETGKPDQPHQADHTRRYTCTGGSRKDDRAHE